MATSETNEAYCVRVSFIGFIMRSGTTNNQVTEAPDVFMAPEEYMYLELLNSQFDEAS